MREVMIRDMWTIICKPVNQHRCQTITKINRSFIRRLILRLIAILLRSRNNGISRLATTGLLRTIRVIMVLPFTQCQIKLVRRPLMLRSWILRLLIGTPAVTTNWRLRRLAIRLPVNRSWPLNRNMTGPKVPLRTQPRLLITMPRVTITRFITLPYHCKPTLAGSTNNQPRLLMPK